jgi:hypothetical protein
VRELQKILSGPATSPIFLTEVNEGNEGVTSQPFEAALELLPFVIFVSFCKKITLLRLGW